MPTRRDSSPPRRPRRRAAWAVVGGAAAIAVAAIVAARWTPGWYASRLTTGDAATVERDARRLVTTIAGLRATAADPGEWAAAIREDEINAWLATDLPRNHATALPARTSDPRVLLEPGTIRLAMQVECGPLSGPATLDVAVRLRAVNRVECDVGAARIGAIPLPTGPVLHSLAALLGRLGFVAEVRRLDGRPVVVVSLGGRGVVLRGLTVASGELVVAGTTEERR